MIRVRERFRIGLQFIGVIVALEFSYFLSGYIFWLNHDVLDFYWAASYVFFPDHYQVGFWVIALLSLCAVPLVFIRRRLPILTERSILVVLFVASIANAITFWSVPEINPDATLWNYQAGYVASHGLFSFITGFGSSVVSSSGLPIPSLIFGIAYTLFGFHRYVIQAVNTVFFGLTTVLAYFIGKNLFDRRTGTYAGLCFLSSPFVISQVPLMLVDVISSFFMILSIFSFTVMVKSRRITIAALSIIPFALALLSKVTSAFVLVPIMVVIFVWGLFRSKQKSSRRLLMRNLAMFLFLVGLLGFMILPFYARISSSFLYRDPFSVAIAQVLHPPMLQRAPDIVLNAIEKSLILSVTIPLLALSLLGAFIGFRKRDRRPGYVILVVWVGILTLLFFEPLTINSAARWIMPTYPAYSIAGAALLTRIRDRRFRRTLLAAILIFSVVSAHFMYAYAWDQSTSRSLMYAADFLQQSSASNSSIRVCGSHVAEWMNIYDSRIQPQASMSPFYTGPFSLFQCVNPNQTLPQYLVLVKGECCSGIYSLYPTLSPAELDFLKVHYTLLRVFSGGDMQGPWVGMQADIYVLKQQN